MELVIALFIGAWLSAGCVLAYRGLRRDFEPFLKDEGKEGEHHGYKKKSS